MVGGGTFLISHVHSEMYDSRHGERCAEKQVDNQLISHLNPQCMFGTCAYTQVIFLYAIVGYTDGFVYDGELSVLIHSRVHSQCVARSNLISWSVS